MTATKKKTLDAAFKNVTASSIVYGEGSDGNPLASSTPWCQLYIPATTYVNPPKGAYPIVDVSYLLFYGNNNGVHVSDKEALIKSSSRRQQIKSRIRSSTRRYPRESKRRL